MHVTLFGRCLRGLALALLLLVPAASWAANPLDPTAAEVASANANTVEVVSGGVDGTYIRIATDLSSVLDAGDQLRVLAVVGRGSLQNVSYVLYLRGIDIGLVQSDVLAYAKLNHLYPGLEKSLQYISKLYDEEVHVLARPEIKAIEDLAGKKVNVDVRGSGTAMTASVLFQGLGVAAEPTYDTQQTALEKLKNGEIAALVYVAGKPAKLFSGLGADTGLHFLSVPLAERLADTYLPAELDHDSYPALVADKPVDTIAVGSVMAVFAWSPRTERYARVSRFVDAFFSKFQQFLQPPHHPKWHEVNLAAQVPGWTRFAPAKAALDR
ncbi:MAG: TAXI family TRAP transporter solute-binding subunit, partial [Acetobacteraceae bacterium]|nr:TAXI family TRAP transporter solute-binding subunit [Acetobacteraceae bacterium]